MERGAVYNRELATQVRDFTGLRIGNITPTDIDGLIEYKNRGFVFIEAKRVGASLPYGQKLALQRLCDALSKPAILFVVEHETDGDIDFAKTTVREYYWKGQWITPERKDLSLREAIDLILLGWEGGRE